MGLSYFQNVFAAQATLAVLDQSNSGLNQFASYGLHKFVQTTAPFTLNPTFAT